jgi:hypothetical protein
MQSPNTGGNLGIITGMLGAPDCMQSPNIGGNLGNLAEMESVMDCTQSGKYCWILGDAWSSVLHTVTKHWWNLGIIAGMHSVMGWQSPNIGGNLGVIAKLLLWTACSRQTLVETLAI